MEDNFEEPETGIMLDSYLSLASHICRSSPEARNWLLKDQPFHLGEVMFQLARTATIARVRACCLDLLA
ncbi:UNVERIFIED_CONTAM: nuclear pore complex Nup192/Nup205 family protein, partial [Bacteroidetes bacterium 56_B9]